jgi:hypothetical protein
MDLVNKSADRKICRSQLTLLDRQSGVLGWDTSRRQTQTPGRCSLTEKQFRRVAFQAFPSTWDGMKGDPSIKVARILMGASTLSERSAVLPPT